jgi:hypothetical protein
MRHLRRCHRLRKGTRLRPCLRRHLAEPSLNVTSMSSPPPAEPWPVQMRPRVQWYGRQRTSALRRHGRAVVAAARAGAVARIATR